MLPASADDQITERKTLFTILFLLINALVWLFITDYLIEGFVSGLSLVEMDEILVWCSYYSSIMLLGVIGAVFSKKVNRLRFIFVWTLFGVLVSLLPIIFSNPSLVELVIIVILLGGVAGVGMSSCLSFFADYTKITNRGLFSGVAFLCINLFASVFSLVFANSDFFVNWILLTVWRGIGLVPFLMLPLVDEKMRSTKAHDDSLKSVITNRGFYLYFVAWFMFMLVDRSEDPTLRFVLDDLRYNVLAPIIGSVSALAAGILADRIGRKKLLLPGFVIFGVAYALIGLLPENLIARYFFITIESISGGILLVAFILILWGDLSEFSSREKYYALGLIPFFLTSIIQLFSGPFFMAIENTNAFTLAVFFLFMALLPLWVAPETLPEKNIELRRLKTFAEEAKKAREKFENNS